MTEYGRRRDGPSSLALLAYSAALTAFLLIPPYIKASVGPPRAFTGQEAMDLLTPIVIIPLAWLALGGGGALGRGGSLAFLVIAALWVEGQAMHLAANAIGDAFPDQAGATAFYATVPGDLDHWLDEVLSHWLWHIAWVLFSVLLLAIARASDPRPHLGRTARVDVPAALGGLLHGVTFFIVSVEGVTAALGIPATLLLLGWSAIQSSNSGGRSRSPAVDFMLVSTVASLVGYAVWAALHGGSLPEFSKVGLFR